MKMKIFSQSQVPELCHRLLKTGFRGRETKEEQILTLEIERESRNRSSTSIAENITITKSEILPTFSVDL